MRAFILLLLAVCAHAGITDPNFADGRKVIVHLFEWKWTDIAEECESFLGPYGFAGVQVSPPSTHVNINNPPWPWWQRYQPLSYNLESRSGSEGEFVDMVSRCNDVGVRIYVDAVINHMSASDEYYYDYKDVPYDSTNFNVPNGNCNTETGNIGDYSNAWEVRNCNLLGLHDLDFRVASTRDAVTGYLNKLINYGVAGFRIDAAKHMAVSEVENIVNSLNNCQWGGRPYIFQEVIDQGGEPITAGEYTGTGDVTEFKYCSKISNLGFGADNLKWYYNFGEAWGMLPSSQAVVFVDNHDNQRGHGGAGTVVTYKDSTEYKKATAFALAWDYGTTRIMSSYKFDNGDQGPPSDASGNTLTPSRSGNGVCLDDWVCEHRWRQIRNMACFRNAAGSEPVQNWFDNGNNFIAFSRGNKAFFALSNEGYTVGEWLQTGLPGGTYCDLISGDPDSSGGCTGTTVTVYDDGKAYISLESGIDSMIALTVYAKAGSLNSNQPCQWGW